jgi:hypothetical protein
MTTATGTSLQTGPRAWGALFRRQATALGRHWPAALFATCTLATLACLGLISWQGIPTGTPAFAAGSVLPEAAGRQDARWPAAMEAATGQPAAASGSRPAAPVPESEWQQQRAEALAIERLNNEMMPLTPGVSADQYVAADDDLGPDAAQALTAEMNEDEGEETAEGDD